MPICASVRVVLSSVSAIHCLAAVTLVQRISVVVCSACMQARPTIVLPAPHGSTMTPLPPAEWRTSSKARAAEFW